MESIDINLILDASGSMNHLINDTIGGFNKFIAEQKQEPGDAYVTLWTFDANVKQRYQGVNINEVPALDYDGYMLGHGGSTALFDAVGEAIKKYESLPIRAAKAMFVIDTDGENNVLREYTIEKIRELITHHQSVDGWAFIFLGANSSEWQGNSMGSSSVGVYSASAGGMSAKYSTMSMNTSSMRNSGLTASASSATMDWSSADPAIVQPIDTTTKK